MQRRIKAKHAPLKFGGRHRVIRFAVVFTVLVALGSVTELYMLRNDGGGTLRRWIATTVGAGLHAAGLPAHTQGTSVHVGRSHVEVAVECTGIKSTAIFWAGVLAFPCSRRARVAGLAIGLFGVGLLNILRIAMLAVVAGYRDSWFDSFHAVLMQGFLILFVAPLWVAWMLLANRTSTPPIGSVSCVDSSPGLS